MTSPILPRLHLFPASQLGHDCWHSILISAVRALAALQVAAAHLRAEFFPGLGSLENAALWYQALAFFTGFAHQAALVFFLISGWLVGGSFLNKMHQPDALRLYAIDRVTRLWTVLIPTFALMLAFGILTGVLDPRSADFSGANPYSATALAGNLLGLQTVSVPAFGGNFPLWSLANTTWYYLLFPLAMGCIAAGCSRRLLLPGALALLMALLLPTTLVLYFSVWLLGAGFSHLRLACSALIRIVLLMALLTLSVWFRLTGATDGITPQSYLPHLSLGVLFALFLSSTVIKADPGIRLVAPLRATATFFSNFSYTLYVVHVPVTGMFGWLGVHLLNQRHLAPERLADLGAYLALLALVMLFSYGFYCLFEARTDEVRRWLKASLSSAPLPNRRAMPAEH